MRCAFEIDRPCSLRRWLRVAVRKLQECYQTGRDNDNDGRGDGEYFDDISITVGNEVHRVYTSGTLEGTDDDLQEIPQVLDSLNKQWHALTHRDDDLLSKRSQKKIENDAKLKRQTASVERQPASVAAAPGGSQLRQPSTPMPASGSPAPSSAAHMAVPRPEKGSGTGQVTAQRNNADDEGGGEVIANDLEKAVRSGAAVSSAAASGSDIQGCGSGRDSEIMSPNAAAECGSAAAAASGGAATAYGIYSSSSPSTAAIATSKKKIGERKDEAGPPPPPPLPSPTPPESPSSFHPSPEEEEEAAVREEDTPGKGSDRSPGTSSFRDTDLEPAPAARLDPTKCSDPGGKDFVHPSAESRALHSAPLRAGGSEAGARSGVGGAGGCPREAGERSGERGVHVAPLTPEGAQKWHVKLWRKLLLTGERHVRAYGIRSRDAGPVTLSHCEQGGSKMEPV